MAEAAHRTGTLRLYLQPSTVLVTFKGLYGVLQTIPYYVFDVLVVA